MSNATREINRITTAIIRISVKLIVYALIILLLYEAVTKGYAFGHEIFYAEAVEEAPGRDKTITIEPDTSVNEAARLLADDGLIGSEFAFIFQSKFYDYDTIYPGVYDLNTSMTSKEILQALNVKPEGEKETEDQKGTARLKTTDGTAAPASAGAQKANAGAQSAAADGQKTDGADSAGSGQKAAGGSEAAGGGQAADSGQAADGAGTGRAADGQKAAGVGASSGQAAQNPESAVPVTDAAGQPVQEGLGGDNPEDYLDEGEGDGGWIQDIGEGANQ